MKLKHLIHSIKFIIIVIAATAFSTTGVLCQTEDYAILVYMNGSNLESEKQQATKAIKQMMEVSGNFTFPGAFIVETGGTKIWHTAELENSHNTRFLVKEGKLQEVSKLSKRSMGDVQTLRDFIDYGINVVDAEHYILIFWNHGEGSLKGFGHDELNKLDTLTLEEMSQAFQSSKAVQTKFDLIGFDACLMSTLETANVLYKYADYMLASQEIEKQGGWDYTKFDILCAGDVTIEKLAKNIMNNYVIDEQNYSLSLWNLKETVNLVNALNIALNKQKHDYESLCREVLKDRKFLPDFGGNISQKTMNYEYPDMTDLDGFMAIVADNETLDLYEAAKAKTIIYHLSTGYSTQPGGINIFLPYGKSFGKEKLLAYSKTGFSEQYFDFINKYYEVLKDKNTFYVDNAPKIDNLGNLYLDIDTKNVKDVNSSVFMPLKHGRYSSLGYIICDCKTYTNGISARKPKLWLNAFNQPLYIIEKSKNTYLAPMLLKRGHTELMINVEICFNPQNRTFKINNITEMSKDIFASRQLESIESGDFITPIYPVFDFSDKKNKLIEEPKYISFERGNEKQVKIKNIIGLSFREINSIYQFRFLIEDTFGGKYYSLPAIKQ